MKKFSLFIIAAAIAIGFSAFTSPKSSTTYYYQDSSNQWQSIDGSLVSCIPGTVNNCFETINGTSRQIFKSMSTSDPLKYN
ncbi:MAG: DUF6520 family protein [Bacteroidota bacterium]|nr:DUF6520 family protein [Bacteroidota bacterium]